MTTVSIDLPSADFLVFSLNLPQIHFKIGNIICSLTPLKLSNF